VASPAVAAEEVVIGDAAYFVATGGSGPPVLLLHGFPQTHRCWDRVAPALSARHRVVLVDIRGYGASNAPPGGPRGEGYSKREMAHELVELMHMLGHDVFNVVGHDRGARIAFRMALDAPERVGRLAVLNIVPTVDQFERMGDGPSLGYWPWFFLAQPAPFPERMIAGNPAAFVEHAFDTWASDPSAITPEHRKAYVQALTPSTIAAMCADYRASFHIDRQHDANDRRAQRRIDVPVLVVVGRDEPQLADAGEVWRRWGEHVSVTTTPGGHFIPEEAPDHVVATLTDFLGRAPATEATC
jgi:haloacetate dehalogenase